MIFRLKNQAGFTLIEIIAVLVILGIMAALVVPKFVDLEENAADRAIDWGISELNGRESLTWSRIKISPIGWEDDATLFTQINKDLGSDYTWSGAPTAGGGGNLQFQMRVTVPLMRTVSTPSVPAAWERQ